MAPLFVLAIVALGPGGAQAVTITFDAGIGDPPSYTEFGLTVTSIHSAPSAHLHMGDSDSDGSPDLRNHDGPTGEGSGCCSSSPYRFTMGGSLFTLVSMHIEGITNGQSTFINEDTSVSVPVPWPGTEYTFMFPVGFTATSFRWTTDAPPNPFGATMTIDNLVINEQVPMPEPMSLLLLGLGVVAVGFVRRRAAR